MGRATGAGKPKLIRGSHVMRAKPCCMHRANHRKKYSPVAVGVVPRKGPARREPVTRIRSVPTRGPHRSTHSTVTWCGRPNSITLLLQGGGRREDPEGTISSSTHLNMPDALRKNGSSRNFWLWPACALRGFSITYFCPSCSRSVCELVSAIAI